LPPIQHELFVQKRDKLIATSLSDSKDNISLLNSSTDTNTILTNNIMSCAVCKKHYKSKNALQNHYGSKMHKQNLEKVEAESTSTISIGTGNMDDNLTDIVSSQSQSQNVCTLANKKPRVKREWKTKSSTLDLFSDFESADIESNLIYMFNEYNFKIPFPDEVSNMHELLY